MELAIALSALPVHITCSHSTGAIISFLLLHWRNPPRLQAHNKSDIILRLPVGKRIREIRWLSVWCRRFTVSSNCAMTCLLIIITIIKLVLSVHCPTVPIEIHFISAEYPSLISKVLEISRAPIRRTINSCLLSMRYNSPRLFPVLAMNWRDVNFLTMFVVFVSGGLWSRFDW